MCGITGFVDANRQRSRDTLETIVRGMAAPIERRGPDAYGQWFDLSAGVAFAHRRLSIIDLSPTGSQPMLSADGSIAVLMNGEIYNYPELREELQSLGVRFRGTSDTEVLVEGIVRWGFEQALNRIIGMFAIACWDMRTQTLFLARDRMGEKPLAYGYAGGDFVFGSTTDTLAAHPNFRTTINSDALALYFQFKAVPSPHTIYSDARKLPPAHWCKITLDQMRSRIWPETQPYWSLRDVAESSRHRTDISDIEALKELDARLVQAVKGCMLSDVPLGAFLSGGIDSSTVVALMQSLSSRPVKTFTIGFDTASYNEAPDARAIAKYLGTEHTEVVLSEADALSLVPEMASFYDEPFADASQIPTSFVSRIARQHVTVALSGDGGDEVFCGYNRQVELSRLHAKLAHWPLPARRAVSKMLKLIPTRYFEQVLRGRRTGVLGDQIEKFADILPLSSIEDMYVHLASYWPDPGLVVRGGSGVTSLLSERSSWPQDLSPLMKLLWVEASGSLPDDMLVKVDRAGMAYSLEGRMPLLDPRVLEFAWSLPDRFRVRDGQSKWALRQSLYSRVPREMMERPKSGFGVPIDEWLKGPLRDWADSLLVPSRLESVGLQPEPIVTCWQEHLSGRRKWQGRLWTVLMLMTWLEHRQAGRTSPSLAGVV